MNLSNVECKKPLVILKINLPPSHKKRLQELGIREGGSIMVTKKRKGAYVILSVFETYYALRFGDAEKIEVRLFNKNNREGMQGNE